MTAVFWVTAVVAVFTGLNVILQRNPVYCALFLVANFFCLAVFYVLLDAQFLAAVQVIVYAGAIMVLFLFVVTLLSPGREEGTGDVLGAFRIPAMILGAVLAAVLVVQVVTNNLGGPAGTGHFTLDSSCPTPPPHHTGGGLGCVNTIGDQLFSTYLLPFEITSFLLLLAMLGAVVLAKRKIS
ncbi:MAG: NADH-quinone oxidoreductase subunit J family protein [Chloroflexota bacterium]